MTSVLELLLSFESLQCQIGPVLLYFDLLKLHCMMRLHCLSFKIFSVLTDTYKHLICQVECWVIDYIETFQLCKKPESIEIANLLKQFNQT